MSEITDVGAHYSPQFERVEMSNLDKVFERNRITKQGIDAIITNYLKLEGELAEAKKDAKRYRWLRDNTCKNSLYEHCGIEGCDTEVMISGEVLDAAIDAAIDEAMKAGK